MPKKKQQAMQRPSVVPQAIALWTLAILCLVTIGVVSVLHNRNLLGQVSSDTATSSASGSVRQAVEALEEERLEAQWQARLAIADTFFVELRSERSSVAGLRRFLEQSAIRQLEHRRTCAADLRAASKFTKLPVTLRCLKADLQLETERLRRQLEHVEQMLGVQEGTRALALTRLTLLNDAIKAIITGIDSNVYAVEEDLEESKRNLLTNYREPAWLLLTKLRAEQLSTWADALITRAAQVAESAPVEGDSALSGITCLEDGRQLLHAVDLATTFEQANSGLQTAIDHLQSCPDVLIAAFDLSAETEEEASSEEAVPETLSRTQRRLLQQ